MAHAPSQDTKVADLPTIIIDPSVYEPERPPRSHSLGHNVRRLTRVMLLVSAVGTTTIVVADMLEGDSFSLREEALALTTRLSDLTNRPAAKPSRVLSSEVALASVPTPAPFARQAEAVVETPEVSTIVPAPAELGSAQAEAVSPEATSASARLPSPSAAGEPARAPSQEPDPVSAVTTPAVIHPTLPEILWNARRMLALNRLEDAEAAYRKVLAYRDGQPAALVGLARVQLTRGQLDEALASAQRAVSKAPDQASSHLALGDVLRARGDKAAAQVQYEQATQRSGNQATSESAARADASN